jgi:hypothetical protein
MNAQEPDLISETPLVAYSIVVEIDMPDPHSDPQPFTVEAKVKVGETSLWDGWVTWDAVAGDSASRLNAKFRAADQAIRNWTDKW